MKPLKTTIIHNNYILLFLYVDLTKIYTSNPQACFISKHVDTATHQLQVLHSHIARRIRQTLAMCDVLGPPQLICIFQRYDVYRPPPKSKHVQECSVVQDVRIWESKRTLKKTYIRLLNICQIKLRCTTPSHFGTNEPSIALECFGILSGIAAPSLCSELIKRASQMINKDAMVLTTRSWVKSLKFLKWRNSTLLSFAGKFNRGSIRVRTPNAFSGV